jgi:hypothetical protein
MTPEVREKLWRLCTQIQTEQDPAAFTALLIELDELLEANECEFAEVVRKDPLLRPAMAERARANRYGHA